MTQRSEGIRHQESGLTSVGGIGVAELGTHQLFLHAELDPEREEHVNESDEPAPLRDGRSHAKKSGRNAGVVGATNHGIGTSGDQFVALLNGDGSSQPGGPKASQPELEVKLGHRDASWREEDDRDQVNEDAPDARGSQLEALGGFGIGGFVIPIEKKENPNHRKERFAEPEH